MGIKKTIIWNSISQFGQSGIQFLSTIILARLLSPDDFAIIGMVTIFITLGSMMVDSEMGGALLRKTTVTKTDYSTLFYYNFGISIIIYFILFFSAPLISEFYNRPILISIIRIIGIVIIIHAFRIVQQVMIFRDLKFKTYAIITIISGSVSLGISIILAYKGFGYWAIVWQYITAAFVNVMLMCLYNRFIPILRFSKASFKEQFSFGLSLLASDSLKVIANNISLNIIAKVAPLNITGYYTQYMRIMSFSQNFIGSLMNQSIFPTMAKITSLQEIHNLSTKLFHTILLFTICSTILVSIFAHPIIKIALGELWISESWIFIVLSLTIMPIAVQILNRNILKAVGNTSLVLKIETIKSVIILIILFLAILGGLDMIIWSVPIGQTFTTIYSIKKTFEEIGDSNKNELILFIFSSLILYFVTVLLIY